MEALLADHPFLGESYSYADIAFYMAQLFGARMGAGMDDGTPRLLAWRDRMTARDAVQQVMRPLVRYLSSQARPIPDFLGDLTRT
jgi:glutathione S-transferase